MVDVDGFVLAVQRKDDERVVFSWITWPSRGVRDAGMKRVMDHHPSDPRDPRMREMQMPFDGQRMSFGGFQAIREA